MQSRSAFDCPFSKNQGKASQKQKRKEELLFRHKSINRSRPNSLRLYRMWLSQWQVKQQMPASKCACFTMSWQEENSFLLKSCSMKNKACLPCSQIHRFRKDSSTVINIFSKTSLTWILFWLISQRNLNKLDMSMQPQACLQHYVIDAVTFPL